MMRKDVVMSRYEQIPTDGWDGRVIVLGIAAVLCGHTVLEYGHLLLHHDSS